MKRVDDNSAVAIWVRSKIVVDEGSAYAGPAGRVRPAGLWARTGIDTAARKMKSVSRGSGVPQRAGAEALPELGRSATGRVEKAIGRRR